MNILYLDHYAGSIKHGRSFRPYYLGKEWVKEGHKLTVVGGSYSHIRNQQPVNPGLENIAGIDYLWLKTPEYSGNGIKRVFSMIVFTLQLFRNTRKIIKLSKPDVIIGSTVYMFDMFPGWLMSKITGARLVFELHDIWPLSPMELGNMSKWHPFILALRFAEIFTYKVSSRVISILPKTYNHMKQFGVKESQFFHIPNGIDLDDWSNSQPLPPDIKKTITGLQAQGLFLIGYAGSHAVSNALNILLDAAEILKGENVHFVLIGDGQEKQNLQNYAKDKGLNNITFIGRISKNSIPDALNMMDALYLGWQKQPLYRFGIGANKIFDYMMAEKPIIHSVTAGNDPVKDAGAGISVEAENSQALATAILELKNKPVTDRQKMAKNGKEYVLAHNNYKILAKEFLKALM